MMGGACAIEFVTDMGRSAEVSPMWVLRYLHNLADLNISLHKYSRDMNSKPVPLSLSMQLKDVPAGR